MDPADLRTEALKREWTDQFVEVNPERPELKRFAGIVGRVVTVNQNNKAVVDFQDGGWYDITASDGVSDASSIPPRPRPSTRRRQQCPTDPENRVDPNAKSRLRTRRSE